MLHQYSRHEPSTKTFDVPESKILGGKAVTEAGGTAVDPMFGFLDLDNIFAAHTNPYQHNSKPKPETKRLGSIAKFRRTNTQK